MMTDYELLSMFNEYETIMQTSFMNFVTIVFAFVIASFFVAGSGQREGHEGFFQLHGRACLNQRGPLFFASLKRFVVNSRLFPRIT